MNFASLTAISVAAAVPFASSAPSAALAEAHSGARLGIRAPFGTTQNIFLYPDSARSEDMRQSYFNPSSPRPLLVSFRPEGDETGDGPQPTPAELISEFRRLSGLTWNQIAKAFNVSRRAAFDWMSGKAVAAKNHQRLGAAVATLRWIDRGSADENRNLLMKDAGGGLTLLDLLNQERWDEVRASAGKGVGRGTFSRALTEDAERHNARRRPWEMLEGLAAAEQVEILPLEKPQTRRIKVVRRRQG